MASNGLFKKTTPPCPQCGSDLLIRRSKQGYFWQCQAYPDCNYRQNTQQIDKGIVKQLTDTYCPTCQAPLVMRQGQYGLFISCLHYPTCDYHRAIDDRQTTQISCPACQQGELMMRLSRYGKHFYGCSRYPTCRFTLTDKPRVGSCQQCHYPVLVAKQIDQQWQPVCPRCQSVQNESE